MTDKRIDELPEATAVNDADLFVIEQGGVAKRASGAKVNADFKTYAGKYAKAKRFVGTSATHQFVLNDKNIADIYNAQMSGNQIVYLYDTLTTITYRVNYCFIDSQGYMCILACAQHFDGDALMPIENRFSDYLYVKTRTHGAASMQLYTKSQDSGGGGGGSSAGVVKVGLSYNPGTHTYTSDKTYAQIISAIGSGNNVFAVVNNSFFFNLDYYTGEDAPDPYVEFTRTWATTDEEYQEWYHQRIKISAVAISDETINNHVVI